MENYHLKIPLKHAAYHRDKWLPTTRPLSKDGHCMSKQISTEEFDRRFDEGEDITAFLDTSAIRHPNREKKTVNVDFPLWMVNALDKEAKTLGVSRQALIKTVLGRHLQERKGQ